MVRDEEVIPLEEGSPNVGESVFVFDSCWGEWGYAEYQGRSGGRHLFSEGHNAYGEEQFAERPTHFWRPELPGTPR